MPIKNLFFFGKPIPERDLLYFKPTYEENKIIRQFYRTMIWGGLVCFALFSIGTWRILTRRSMIPHVPFIAVVGAPFLAGLTGVALNQYVADLYFMPKIMRLPNSQLALELRRAAKKQENIKKRIKGEVPLPEDPDLQPK